MGHVHLSPLSEEEKDVKAGLEQGLEYPQTRALLLLSSQQRSWGVKYKGRNYLKNKRKLSPSDQVLKVTQTPLLGDPSLNHGHEEPPGWWDQGRQQDGAGRWNPCPPSESTCPSGGGRGSQTHRTTRSLQTPSLARARGRVLGARAQQPTSQVHRDRKEGGGAAELRRLRGDRFPFP